MTGVGTDVSLSFGSYCAPFCAPLLLSFPRPPHQSSLAFIAILPLFFPNTYTLPTCLFWEFQAVPVVVNIFQENPSAALFAGRLRFVTILGIVAIYFHAYNFWTSRA
jgi:hypothetical protein